MTGHTLKDAFLEDHQKMTRGLSELIHLVEADRMALATSKARELDALAGAHIEFEETLFYPQVQKSRGEAYVANLYDEHQSGVEAIRALEAIEDPNAVDDAERRRILGHLRRALEHAFSCGTLVSHLTSLSENDQQGLLTELERLREAGHLWTELEKRLTVTE
jgi:Hemerythrin HHE cation binding domain